MINIRAWLGLAYYTSPIDQFLTDFDKTHPHLSTSQRKEIDKYKRIYAMRDNPNYTPPKEDFWEHF